MPPRIARPSRRALLAAPALAFSLAAGPSASAQAVAEALAPGWTALPAETIACVRVPDARGFPSRPPPRTRRSRGPRLRTASTATRPCG